MIPETISNGHTVAQTVVSQVGNRDFLNVLFLICRACSGGGNFLDYLPPFIYLLLKWIRQCDLERFKIYTTGPCENSADYRRTFLLPERPSFVYIHLTEGMLAANAIASVEGIELSIDSRESNQFQSKTKKSKILC